MNRTLLTALIGVGSLILGIAATAGIYETTVVSRLKHDLIVYQGAAYVNRERVEEAWATIESCQRTVNVLFSITSDYSDAYDRNRDAVDNFFDRYNFAAGDANYLYALLYAGDGDMLTAASKYSSITGADMPDCVTYVE